MTKKLICDKRNNCEFGRYCICAKPFIAGPIRECKLNSDVTFSIADDDNKPTDDEIRAMWLNAGGTFHGPITETATMTEERIIKFIRSLL